MIKLTIGEKEMLTDELLNLSKKLNNDVVIDLESSCNTLRELLQDVPFGCIECDKIHNLNKKNHNLKQDTDTLCGDVKRLLNDVEIVNE